jgi:outer membrane protein OmpA-like peptidoglycan-associated protein
MENRAENTSLTAAQFGIQPVLERPEKLCADRRYSRGKGTAEAQKAPQYRRNFAMKIRSLMVLPLAATMMLPAVAQQSTTTPDQQNQATQSQPAPVQNDQNAQAQSSDDISNRQPLQADTREGFWGKINPFARKKYVQRQMTPIRNRVNELDDLTAANSKNIKDVDSRAQEGIRQSMAKANDADQHALAAGNTAQQANQTAQQASTRLQTVESVVNNYDQYATSNQTEIRFRSGASVLSKNAKAALDDLASNLKDQKNYIIEVQGFAPGAGSVQSSQRMADSVVRYLVENHEIPVYRVYTLGLGNAKVQAAQTSADASGRPARPYRGPRVEISVLKNSSVDQLNQQAMAAPQGAVPAAGSQPQSISSPASTNTGMNNSQPATQQPSPNSQPQQ